MTPKPKRWFLLLLLCATTAAQAQQRYELTVKDAADLARKNSVPVKNALLDIQLQEQTNREITAAAYPQINGNLGITYNPLVLAQRFPNFIALGTYGVLMQEGVKNGSGQPIMMPNDVGFIEAAFGTKWTNSAGVTLQQLLFDGQVFVGLQARKASIELANRNKEVTEQQIVTNVHKVYFQLAAAKYKIGFIETSIARASKLASDTRKMYEAGVVERLDVDKANVQLSNLQTERIKANNEIDNGYLGLKVLLGLSVRDSIVLKDTVSYEQVRNGVLDASQYNYSDRKEYQLLEKVIELNKYNIKRYQYTYLPTVALSSNYNVLRQSDKFGFGGPYSKGASIGLAVQVPIFDGFAKAARVQRARIELLKSQNNLEGLKQSIDNQVYTARNSYNNALVTLEAQKRNLDLAEKVYNQTRKKYEAGTGSQMEITLADADLRDAQNNYTAALYDAIVARIDFLNATGKLQ